MYKKTIKYEFFNFSTCKKYCNCHGQKTLDTSVNTYHSCPASPSTRASAHTSAKILRPWYLIYYIIYSSVFLKTLEHVRLMLLFFFKLLFCNRMPGFCQPAINYKSHGAHLSWSYPFYIDKMRGGQRLSWYALSARHVLLARIVGANGCLGFRGVQKIEWE